MLNEPIVRVSGLSVVIEGRELLGELTLDIVAGNRVCVTGQAGSGKSLLLELMAGRHVSHHGSLSYPAWVQRHPDSILGVPPRFSTRLVSTNEQRRVCSHAASFHQARWHSTMTEPATVAAFLEPRQVIGLHAYEVTPTGLDVALFSARQAALLDDLGIDYLLNRPLSALSNGEWRKLLLVCALLARPRLLLLDDPLGGLDPDARARVVRLLQRCIDEPQVSATSLLADPDSQLLAEPLTLVMTAPRPEELGALTTRVVELKAPRVHAPPKTSSKCQQPEGLLGATAARRKSSGPIMRLRDATVRAARTLLLDSVSLHIEQGEHWLVTGPNGSGKSTLLALIIGDHPQSYVVDIEVLGKRAEPGVPLYERQRGIGSMAPELIMHYPPQWSVTEVVLSGLQGSIGQYSPASMLDQQSAGYWLQRLELEAVADRALCTLCEVDLRKVFLARALIKQPALLLLDEPTQGLQPEPRWQVLELLDQVVHETSVTLLMVSHHTLERPRCITHHLALEHGRTVYLGPMRAEVAPAPTAARSEL